MPLLLPVGLLLLLLLLLILLILRRVLQPSLVRLRMILLELLMRRSLLTEARWGIVSSELRQHTPSTEHNYPTVDSHLKHQASAALHEVAHQVLAKSRRERRRKESPGKDLQTRKRGVPALVKAYHYRHTGGACINQLLGS